MHLEKVLSDQLDALNALRATDPEFKEICDDFEEAASVICELRTEGKESMATLLENWLETLKGLRQEIREQLTRNANSRRSTDI